MATVEHQNMIHKFIFPFHFVKGDTISHFSLFAQQQAQINVTQPPPKGQKEQKTNDSPTLPSAPAPAGVGSGPRMLHIYTIHVSVRDRLYIFLTEQICH